MTFRNMFCFDEIRNSRVLLSRVHCLHKKPQCNHGYKDEAILSLLFLFQKTNIREATSVVCLVGGLVSITAKNTLTRKIEVNIGIGEFVN